MDRTLLFVGTYNVPGPFWASNGSGLHTLALDPETGCLDELAVCKDAVNATYLAKRPGNDFLFAASDRYLDPGRVECYRIDRASGTLERRSSAGAHGTATCHVALDESGSRAFVSSYLDGKLTVHDIREDRVSETAHLFQYEGKSTNAERQEAAHAHQAVVAPGNRWLYVADLGSDKIWIHDLARLDAKPAFFVVPAGYGPRHLVCCPLDSLVYLFCELNARILVLRRDPDRGTLVALSEHDSLPADFTGNPSGAAIRLHPTLRTLCVSNRNHNSLSFFKLDEDGRPSLAEIIPCQGDEPRDFVFDPSGRWLLVANQKSDTVAVFVMDRDRGLPERHAPVCLHPCGSPVSILFDDGVRTLSRHRSILLRQSPE